MVADIQNGLAALKELSGLRGVLWSALLVGICLLAFESVTQYFSYRSLKTKIEIVESLEKMNSTAESKDALMALHSELVVEAKNILQAEQNPGTYLFGVFLRFVQGAYLSLPLFYLLLKVVGFLVRNATDEIKENHQIKQWGILLGSLVFSGATWAATILGGVSVLWNKSENLLVSWFVFPTLSAVILLVLVLWLLVLRILFIGKARNGGTKE